MQRRRVAVVNVKSSFLFNSSFEEKKILEYLRNLISSRFLRYRPVELMKLSYEACGQGEMIELLSAKYPDLFKDCNFSDPIELESFFEKMNQKTLVNLLGNTVLPYIVDKLSKLPSVRNSDLYKRLENIKKTFNLTDEEVEVITCCYLLDSCSLLYDYLDERDGIADFSLFATFKGNGHLLLGIKKNKLSGILSNGSLFESFIIENHRKTFDLTDWCADYLSGMGKDDLSHEFFSLKNNETLDASDFELSENELMVLDTLIKGSSRQNILFYGIPGTGKTSLAKSLAKRYGKALYTVKMSETDEHKDRLRAVYATINLADKDKSIVLVDEADEILNSSGAFFYKNVTNKSWTNTLLDSHQKKVIWITNRIGQIEASTMRRFSFSLEFKKLSRLKRLKVLKYELTKRRLEGYLNNEELNDLCGNYSVNADGIVNAVNILSLCGKIKKEDALKQIKTVLTNHEKAVLGRSTGNQKKKHFDNYSLKGLNTSENLEDIISALKQYIHHSEDNGGGYSISLSLLLYGLPGTGKTEFVHYLSKTLDREVLQKRCSGIQSMWVGQTEKNIAEAFEESLSDNSILFFDEADSFLFPRKDADRSWERSATNEILAQLDSYKGIVVFATNYIDGLDNAALRRFKFKVEFIPLTPEGNLHFYKTLLSPLAGNEVRLSTEMKRRIRVMQNLTPGDFAVVKDRFFFTNNQKISHEMLINALISELGHKKVSSNSIGFECHA